MIQHALQRTINTSPTFIHSLSILYIHADAAVHATVQYDVTRKYGLLHHVGDDLDLIPGSPSPLKGLVGVQDVGSSLK